MADSIAILPVSFFQGKSLEEGARCEVEVIGVDEKQVQVRYVPHEAEPPAEEAGDRTHEEFAGMVDAQVAGGY